MQFAAECQYQYQMANQMNDDNMLMVAVLIIEVNPYMMWDYDPNDDDGEEEFWNFYYHYEGSKTTPPCSETVTWLVMETHGRLNSNQLAALEAMTGKQDMYRPAQPLNGRRVDFDDRFCATDSPTSEPTDPPTDE